MATLLRTAKPGSQWTTHELNAYHISLSREEPTEFFGSPHLPNPAIITEFLFQTDPHTMKTSSEDMTLVQLLDLAMTKESGECVVDFYAIQILKMAGFTNDHRIAVPHKKLSFMICGKTRSAQTDVCIIDHEGQNNIILLVQENKRLTSRTTPTEEPPNAAAQLVAEALAAFTENNKQRISKNLPVLNSRVISGIIMEGTSPTFFKIPITSELLEYVSQGDYPPTQTIVTYCRPSLLAPPRRYSDGMKPLANRREVLQYYEAFKTIVGI